jgi:predicted phosphodiesterase
VRIGVISDVHGNLDALEAALVVLRREKVERYICTGDLVGYGPRPNECVEAVRALEPLCVAGNHDLIAVGALSGERCDPLARRTLRWTREVLDDRSREYLAALPSTQDDDGIVIAHGSLDDPEEYVSYGEQARRQLDLLDRRHPGARLLLLGHTHRPWAQAQRSGTLLAWRSGALELPRGQRLLLNPGSVGQPRERARVVRFLMVDLEHDRATFFATSYPHRRCRRELRRHGLPPGACHRKPTPIRDRARAFRGALQR